MTENKAAQDTAANKQPAVFRMAGQYARDVSFECFKPLHALDDKKHETQMEVGLEGRQLGEHNHEIVIRLKAQGKNADNSALFIAEVVYVGEFYVENLKKEVVPGIMATDGAALIFPFARSVLMQLISQGGYQPPMVEPVNFHGLYARAQQQQARQKAAEGTLATA